MKKLTVLEFVVMVLICGTALGASITLTVPNDKVDQIVDGYIYVHKNREMVTVVNPAYINETATPNEPLTIDEKKYTDIQWLKEHIRRTVIGQAKRGEKAKYIREFNASNITDSDVQ